MEKIQIMNCYNCDGTIGKNSKTKEHIPAKNLFREFNKPLKHEIITVPACIKCNQEFGATLDEEFRNFIVVISANGKNEGLKAIAGRAFVRNINQYSKRYAIINCQKAFEFDINKICKFHKKNLKGLFCFQFGYNISEIYQLIVDIDEEGNNILTQNFIKYLTENFEWKVSGHSDIFKYILTKINKEDLPFDNYPYNDSYVCLMVYNQVHATLVYAINKNEL